MKSTAQEIDRILDDAKRIINSDPALSREKAEEALNLCELCRYEAGRFESLFTLGRICNVFNQSSEAIEYFDECGKIAEKMGDLRRKALAINAHGVTYDNMLIHSKALECYMEALDIAVRNRFMDLECKILNNISTIFSGLKDYQTSLNYLLQAHRKAVEAGEPVSVYLRNIANIYLDINENQKCYEYSILARNAAWREKDGEQRADAYFFLAHVYERRGKLRRAYRYFNLGFELAERYHCFFSHADGCYDLARIFFNREEYDSALSYNEKACEICTRFEYHELLKDVYRLFADIRHMSGDAEGEIEALRKHADICALLDARDLEKKRSYAKMQLSLFNIRKEREYLRTQAFSDPLTGCLSYRDFEVKVREALLETKEKAAMFFMDVDNLKPINDKYGHDAGDQLIIDFADTVRAVMEGRGLIFRKGGDEFIMLLPFSERDELNRFNENLFARLSKPRVIGRTLTYISCSVGIAIYPTDSIDPKELEKMADKAMYHAKKHGKRCCCFYDSIALE
jgi:diguanylate cyclase (GGDEF)-like protein